jgi:hypothetical protein
VADFSLVAELAKGQSTQFAGTAGLARIVMYVNSEPWLTRAKARYELVLLAGRDPELTAILSESAERLHALARQVVTQWYPTGSTPDPALIEDQAVATLAFINGGHVDVRGGSADRRRRRTPRPADPGRHREHG